MSQPYNILVIEDEARGDFIGGYVRANCSKHVGEIRRVETETEFLEALDDREWDIVLVDYGLNRFSAEEALRIVNRRGIDLPSIVVTEVEKNEDIMGVLYAGAEHVVSRDKLERLCITVPRSIANARRRREVSRELQAHRKHLEELVEQRTAELQDVAAQLKEEVNKRRKISDALRESETQYRNLVENAHDGICIIQDRTLRFVNQRFEKMFGYEPGTALGTSFLEFLPPEERVGVMDVYRRVITGDDAVLQKDVVLLKKNGQRMDAAVSSSAIEFDGRRAVMVVIHDITERKQASRMTLENEKLEAVGLVARGVGANFANIINVISSYAVSIADSFLPHTRPHDAARRIIDATRHANMLTNRLLSVVQFSNSKNADVHLESIALTEALEKALDMVAHSLQEKDIKLVIKKRDSLPNVVANRNQLVDTLIAIFMNAIDAMPDGGTLAIKAIERKIARPRSNPNAPGGKFVGISIHDSGIGMSKEEVARVFEPFYTTKDSPNAFGLGLPVAQSMALSWGGWLDIRSRPGKGTRVRIFMPKSGEQSGVSVVRRKSRMTVLVADDNEGRRRMIVNTLADMGHKIIEAADGNSAIDLYKRNADEIDLCIVDWILPGADGKDVLKAIFDHDSQAKVIMVSGFSRDYVRSEVRMGAWGFLQKPFSEEELMREIEKVFRQKR